MIPFLKPTAPTSRRDQRLNGSTVDPSGGDVP
jgi:hypothetical protein